MTDVPDIARVTTFDVVVEMRSGGAFRGIGGISRYRPGGTDWEDAARPVFERYSRVAADPAERRRGASPLTARVEFRPDHPDELDFISATSDPPDTLVRIRLRAGDPQPTVLAIEFRFGATPPTTRWLRNTGLKQALDSAATILQWDRHLHDLPGGRWRAAPKRTGRAGTPDLHYARVAADYVAALDEAPRSPTKAMVAAAAARGEFVTEAQLRAQLGRARKRGLLTTAPAGRPGGRLTAKAERLLRQAERSRS